MTDVIQLLVDSETIAQIWELVTVANEFTGDPTDVQLLKKAAATVATRLHDIDRIDPKRFQNAEQHAKDKLELRCHEARLSTELELVRARLLETEQVFGEQRQDKAGNDLPVQKAPGVVGNKTAETAQGAGRKRTRDKAEKHYTCQHGGRFAPKKRAKRIVTLKTSRNLPSAEPLARKVETLNDDVEEDETLDHEDDEDGWTTEASPPDIRTEASGDEDDASSSASDTTFLLDDFDRSSDEDYEGRRARKPAQPTRRSSRKRSLVFYGKASSPW